MRAAPAVLVCVAFLCITVGAALIYPPAGFIVAGLCLAVIGIAWQASRQPVTDLEPAATLRDAA